MSLKKLLVIFVVLMMALAVANCGQNTDEGQPWEITTPTKKVDGTRKAKTKKKANRDAKEKVEVDALCAQHPEEKVCLSYLGKEKPECLDEEKTDCKKPTDAYDVTWCFTKPKPSLTNNPLDFLPIDDSAEWCPKPGFLFGKGNLLEKVKVVPVNDPQAEKKARKAMAQIFGSYLGLKQILLAQIKAGSPEAKEIEDNLLKLDKEVRRLMPAVQLDTKVVDDTAATVAAGFNVLMGMAKQYDLNERADLKAKCDKIKSANKPLPRPCYYLATE